MSGVEDNKDDLDLERKLGETPEKSSRMSGSRGARRSGRRPGRRPAKVDARAKLERSRQSARECRARKKMRYQYLEELMANREQAIFSLRDELETYRKWCGEVDCGVVTGELRRHIRTLSESGTSSEPQGETDYLCKIETDVDVEIKEEAEGSEVDEEAMVCDMHEMYKAGAFVKIEPCDM
ncbi:hypothetical protein ScPMuIL_007703 [Solemya velum]